MCDRHHANSQPNLNLGASLRNLFSGASPENTLQNEADAEKAQAIEADSTSPSRRRKLWELEERLHCPVVGTCLNLDELKKVARREGFSGSDFDHYRLHVEAVSVSCTRNSTAKAMHKLLEKKFVRWVKLFDKAKNDEEVRSLWDEHLERGEVAGPMWAALTHKAASKDTCNQIYGDVHMVSHQVGAGLAADARRLGFLESEVLRLQNEARQQMHRTNQMLGERAARINALEEEIRKQLRTLEDMAVLKSRAQMLESGQVMIEMGRRLMLLEATNAKQEEALRQAQLQLEQIEQLKSENSRLNKDLASLTAERDIMERLLLSESTQPEKTQPEFGKPACDGDCDHCQDQLNGRCILCVGGRTALLPQYRELARRLGVRLIHHDGGQEEAMSRLPDLLAASDAVICPTDCVSHNAYYQTKRHCKLYNKPCVMTRSSGLAGFAAALSSLASWKSNTLHEA